MKKTTKKLLFMQLRCTPKWWPREKGEPAWVGVLDGGCGWTVGDGDPMSVRELGAAKAAVREDYPEAKFKIRRAP